MPLAKCEFCGKEFLKRDHRRLYCSEKCKEAAFNYRKRTGKMKKKNKKYPAQICWECRKATGGCSWSKSFVPVKGWTAEKCVIRGGNERADDIETYSITACPEFESIFPEKDTAPFSVNMLINFKNYMDMLQFGGMSRRERAFYERRVTLCLRYINSIPDTFTRFIIRARYAAGRTWVSIAMDVGGNNTADSVRKIAERRLRKDGLVE